MLTSYNSLKANQIGSLLIRDIPRDLVMAVDEAFYAGARRAYDKSVGMAEGHLPSVIGQLRHFHMNEAFHRALAMADASPSDIRGNGLISGRCGVFTIARLNIGIRFWNNASRSKLRREMAHANVGIEALVQANLFDRAIEPADAVVFFVACFSGDVNVRPEAPISIQLAVPDRTLKGWLFREPIFQFLERYEPAQVAQTDEAMPTLKRNITKRREGNDE